MPASLSDLLFCAFHIIFAINSFPPPSFSLSFTTFACIRSDTHIFSDAKVKVSHKWKLITFGYTV